MSRICPRFPDGDETHSATLAVAADPFCSWVNRQQQEAVECLRTETSFLNKKLVKQQILLSDEQQRRLAVKGRVLGRKQIEQAGTLFTPDTMLHCTVSW